MKANRARIEAAIRESIQAKERFLATKTEALGRIVDAALRALRRGGKIVIFGNGGSAADACHIATELVGRFKRDRRAIPALSLGTNVQLLTAIANDLGYEESFAREVDAHVGKKDLVIAISTSGNSPNVLTAVARARKKGATIAGFTGARGGKLRSHVDLLLDVPSDDTPRIQECHLLAGHILCDLIESELG